MRKRTLATIIAVSAVLLVICTIVGTLAYMLDQEEVTNTFTVGNVTIDLNETDADGDNDTKYNSYHLIPGATYIEDPTVTVKASSEDSFVRMVLIVHNYSAVKAIIDNDVHGLTDCLDLMKGWDEEVWLYEGSTVDTAANTISYEFRYYTTADGFDDEMNAADDVLPALFDTLILPGTLDGNDLQTLVAGDFKMVIEAHAIQSLGFDGDMDKAWEAFDAQIKR